MRDIPAFPAPEASRQHFGDPSVYMGMTLRDYFASAALAALINKDDKDGVNRGKAGVPNLVKFAYEYADEMLNARLVDG